MLTFLELAHMFDATQIGGFGMLTFFGRTSKIGCQIPCVRKGLGKYIALDLLPPMAMAKRTRVVQRSHGHHR